MSIALHLSNIALSSFQGAKCWEKHENKFKPILRAQELADWMNSHPEIFGNKKIFERRKISPNG